MRGAPQGRQRALREYVRIFGVPRGHASEADARTHDGRVAALLPHCRPPAGEAPAHVLSDTWVESLTDAMPEPVVPWGGYGGGLTVGAFADALTGACSPRRVRPRKVLSAVRVVLRFQEATGRYAFGPTPGGGRRIGSENLVGNLDDR